MPKNGTWETVAAFSTRAIHNGNDPKYEKLSAMVPPISMSTTFKLDIPGEVKSHVYSRLSNPTRDSLEKCLASLEGAKFGLAFSSGMAAVTNITHLLSAGDHIISMDDMYAGTNEYFRSVASRMNMEIDYVDATNPKNVENAMKSNTKMIWIETPTNPTMKVVDIAAVADIVAKQSDCFLVVDNTFMSPYFQRPLELGADISMSSITKYINGHSDVLMGCACTSRTDLHDRLRFLQSTLGSVPSPFDCYLVTRSIKTLAVRMERHKENGLAVATFLEKHPCVKKVIYPGLPSHPQYELFKRQCYGHSGMLSFYLRGNNLEESINFLKELKLFSLAVSLGGSESLCELPSVMTHATLSKEMKDTLRITDGLIRVSCGLEGADDLINDLDQALKHVIMNNEN